MSEKIQTFVTKDMIYKLAKSNAVIYSYMMQVEHGNLDYTSALAACVYYLAKESDEKSKMILKYMELCPRPPGVFNP